MASFTGLKQAGENLLDYMMRHRPTPDLELSAGLHDLGEVFPGIYGNGAKSYAMRDPKVNEEAMSAIMAAQDGHPAGNPAQNELVAAVQQQWEPTTWDDVEHGLSFGTRAVLEGLGGIPGDMVNMVSEPLAGYRFKNPGVTLADAMGLDRPWGNVERTLYGLERGASEAVPVYGTGVGLAKYGSGLAAGAGRALMDAPWVNAILGAIPGAAEGFME